VARFTSARGVVVLAVRRREPVRLFQQRAPPLVLLAAQQRGPHVGQRVRERRAIAEPPRELAGARAERDRLLAALGQHRQLRAAAERHRQLGPLREPLERRDRPVGVLRGFGAAARPPQDARQPAQALARLQRVARRLVHGEQPAPRLQRPLRPPAQVRLDGDTLERLGVGVAGSRERRLQCSSAWR